MTLLITGTITTQNAPSHRNLSKLLSNTCEKASGVEIAVILANFIADQVVRFRVCAVAKGTKWIIDSGSGLDLVSSKSLGKKNKLTDAASPVTMSTANGLTTAQKEWKGYVPG